MATINQNRNKASAYTADTYKFDSREETEFYLFLRDALQLKLIKSFIYQPQSFLLIPKAIEKIKVPYKKKSGYKIVEKVLYQQHSYTADFVFELTDKFFEYFPMIKDLVRVSKNNQVYIDIKGAYNRFGGDRQFEVNRKLVYNKYGVHINKIVPEKFFQKLGAAPDEIRWMKARKTPTLRKPYIGVLSLAEVVGQISNNQCLTHKVEEINIPFLKPRKTHQLLTRQASEFASKTRPQLSK